MEGNLNSQSFIAGGGGGGLQSYGGSSGGSVSTVSKAEEQEDGGDMPMSSEVSSCRSDLDLGLGLSLGGGGRMGHPARFLAAKDFQSPPSSCSSSSSTPRANNGGSAGTKRAADSAGAATANTPNQVVGWPPVRAYRMNSLSSQAKLPVIDPESVVGKSRSRYDVAEKTYYGNDKSIGNTKKNGNIKSSLFVKVNMDGIPIGRKVDLSAQGCYDTLARTLEDMFHRPAMIANAICEPLKLLKGPSDFVLTYEDKDRDWMLVGDVPWGMFIHSVKRLRIMKTSDANGIAPRFEQPNERQRSKPA